MKSQTDRFVPLAIVALLVFFGLEHNFDGVARILVGAGFLGLAYWGSL